MSGREGGMPRDGEKIFLGSRQKSLNSVGNENTTEKHVFECNIFVRGSQTRCSHLRLQLSDRNGKRLTKPRFFANDHSRECFMTNQKMLIDNFAIHLVATSLDLSNKLVRITIRHISFNLSN